MLVCLQCALLGGTIASSQSLFSNGTKVPYTTLRQVPTESADEAARRRDAERAVEFQELARDVEALEPQLGVIKRVARLVAPSVVHIEASPAQDQPFRQEQEAGSGIVVRFGGEAFVLTNHHVIRNSSAPRIRIQFDGGQTINPTRIWSDRETDIAVMAINSPDAPPALLGDSDTLEIGEHVLAFGSPFGLSQSVTRGILSAKGRHNLDLGRSEVPWQNFLQTDAAINPGNSGGPLVNLRGQVIGLNTAIASSSGGNEGIGFSIPINIAVSVARQLITGGEVSRGFLGVQLDGQFNEAIAREIGLARFSGAKVKGVEPGSPAATAALLPNDVILRFDGVPIENSDHLITLVKLTSAGRRVELELFRGGDVLRTYVDVGRQAVDGER
ncbi:S1C family serine protease [Botrimarina hoheduenensis]|uniref:S1C family serine protease n=1 Tax=Botrimarina hoheduenensis TaxID=2528000 RepID=UPI0018D30AC5|nr:trypsin-like peptidase domain-containing protein [Botrimarina hoheduenensis]